jgi:hypothetical protein
MSSTENREAILKEIELKYEAINPKRIHILKDSCGQNQ